MKAAAEPWALLSPEGTYHKLCEPNFFVGREDHMDLTLKSRSVDKQHAVISVNEDNKEYKLHDLGTLNGTFVNEVRVRQQPVNLQLRDNIRFGYDFNTFRVDLCPQREKQHSFHSFNEERQLYDGNNTGCLDSVWESNGSLQSPASERKLSIQPSAHQNNSDEDDRRSISLDQDMLNMYHGVHSPHSPGPTQFPPYPHYPYMTPMYQHPAPVICHCPACTGHRSPVHSPHGVHHQMGLSHAGWGHASPTAFQVRPRLQRPLSVPGDKLKMMVKGSPLYGQPPWWGWGSSDEEIYNYPNTATIHVEGDNQAVGQQALSVRKKKLTKKDALEMTQRRHSVGTVSVLSESKASIITTRTSKTTYRPEQDRALKQRGDLQSPGYSDQLSPVFENSTSRDWEMPNSRSEGPGLAECDSSLENSPDDSSDGHSRPAYEIPLIPDYGEIPERPVSQKSEKGKAASQDDVRSSAVDKQDRTTRKKSSSKIKKRTATADALTRNARAPVTRKHSSDTSESECEPSSHPSRRLGVVTRGTPSSSRVFGLTEVSLQRGRNGDSRENLSPAPLPNWVQQWANAIDNRDNSLVHQPIEVVGSSSATEDSVVSDSFMSSSSHIPVPVQPDASSENKSKPVKNDTLSRPRTAPSRTNSSSVMRSQSLSPSSLSSTPKTTASSRVSRSKTMSTTLNRRSYPMGSANDLDKKTTEIARRRGLVSSTSDDSDFESSDTSGTRQTKDMRGKTDESERKGVQLIPEKDGKRPLSAPRPNKTAMLRAHNSREAVKNGGVKNKTPASAVKSRTTTAQKSLLSTTGNGSGVATNDSSWEARVWTPSARSSTKSSTGDDNFGETGAPCTVDDVTQEEVDELFHSSPVRPLPESLQMNRDHAINKTFVLDEGKGDTSFSCPENSSTQGWVRKAASSENLLECKDAADIKKSSTPSSRTELAQVELESTSTRGISLRNKLIPFAPLLDSPPYTPPAPDHPFEPPSDSPDDISGGSRSSTGEGRSMSPDSAVSAAPAGSPSPPLTPNSASKKTFDFKVGAAPSQSRRQWGVTDKPVEDLMLSSIHAFSVELRLASESVLSKVKTLYDGSEELNESTKPTTDSDSKAEESQSAIPDWKSSHAEIAGIFRNLRKVELRLRTMEQALSIMCVAAQKEPKQERKLSMVESSKLVSGQKWREFKLRARRNSWAVEHRNQFPLPPAESDEEDEDTP